MGVKLGDRVKDRITGFTGIAIARTEYLAGCVRVQIQPEAIDKDGKPVEDIWFDEGLVVVVKENGEKKAKRTGGPGDVPPRRETDMR